MPASTPAIGAVVPLSECRRRIPVKERPVPNKSLAGLTACVNGAARNSARKADALAGCRAENELAAKGAPLRGLSGRRVFVDHRGWTILPAGAGRPLVARLRDRARRRFWFNVRAARSGRGPPVADRAAPRLAPNRGIVKESGRPGRRRVAERSPAPDTTASAARAAYRTVDAAFAGPLRQGLKKRTATAGSVWAYGSWRRWGHLRGDER